MRVFIEGSFFTPVYTKENNTSTKYVAVEPQYNKSALRIKRDLTTIIKAIDQGESVDRLTTS